MNKLLASFTLGVLSLSFQIGASDCSSSLDPANTTEIASSENSHVQALREHLVSRMPESPEAIESLTHNLEMYSLGLKASKTMGTFLVAGEKIYARESVAEHLASFANLNPAEIIVIDANAPALNHLARLATPEAQNRVNVVLFKNVELAAPQLWNVLMTMITTGAVPMEKGAISLQNTFLILSTGVGADEAHTILTKNRVGFEAPQGEALRSSPEIQADARRAIEKKLDESYPLAVLKSVDDVLIVNSSRSDLRVKNTLESLQNKYLSQPGQEIAILATEALKLDLQQRASEDALEKSMQKIEIEILKAARSGAIKPGSVIQVDGEGLKPRISVIKTGESAETLRNVISERNL